MPWNEQQQEALWASVEHWLQNWEDPRNADIYSRSCPLCALYLRDKCKNCPICLHTGKPDCENTPWNSILYEINNQNIQITKEFMAKEYRFLVELALGERAPK